VDERHLSFTFYIPPHLPLSNKDESASILVDVEGNRQAIRPLAILISQDSINPSVGQADWNAPMTIVDYWSFEYPYRNILYETIRNTFYHVPMWFVMFILFGVAIFHGIKYLIKKDIYHDIAAASYTSAGVLFGFLGLFSGGLWANYTWGKPFPLDIKIIMTYTCLAIYLAYFLLRMSFDNLEQRARISAVYSIFAFASLIPLLYVVPKLAPDSLHPGNGGNPAFGTQDMDNTMRMVFYPASLGWILLGVWIGTLVFRYRLLDEKIKYN
jgi:heme exporter protein C